MSGRIRRAYYRCNACNAHDSTLLYDNEVTPTAVTCWNCKKLSALTHEETHKADLDAEEQEPEESNAN